MKTGLVVVAAALALGAASGGIARGRQAVRIPIPAPPPSQQLPANDGQEALINVELEPSAVLKDAAGERLEYLVSIAPRKDARSDVAVRYSVEVVADDGTPLQKPSLSPAMAVARGGGHSKALDTPVAGRDGYFVMRVQAAAFDGTEDTLQIAERHFKVKRGTVIPVTPDEYYQSSNAGLGRRP
jgi:hypothetical protein